MWVEEAQQCELLLCQAAGVIQTARIDQFILYDFSTKESLFQSQTSWSVYLDLAIFFHLFIALYWKRGISTVVCYFRKLIHRMAYNLYPQIWSDWNNKRFRKFIIISFNKRVKKVYFFRLFRISYYWIFFRIYFFS